ncbi:family 1 glycosylhydrolase [Bacillus sp. WP8]|uniref:family 1 glycosylhydrolase n=1 Tax=Bacillus sp. WP8 TaxID=756828 RepID=UPI0037BE4F5E
MDELWRYEIEGMVRMYDFDVGDGVEVKGGWCKGGRVDGFEGYGEVLLKEYGEKVK